MTAKSLPQEILADYASGAASPGVSLLVASHLTHSPEGRHRLAGFEAVGGALLADEAPASMSDDALDRAMEKLDQPEPAASAIGGGGPLPRPLAAAVGIPFDAIPWRFRLPGLAEYELDGYGDDQHVSLLRARPGTRIPQHTHEGLEMTLVLAGQLSDGGHVYGPGEVAINTDEHDHKPEILGDETCYCLIVMDGRMRFTGPFSRLLNIFGD